MPSRRAQARQQDVAVREPERTQLTFSSVRWSGPLPPAAELERLEALMPGIGDRLMSMAEAQTAHRISLEQQVIAADITRSSRGLHLGFVLAVIVVVGSIALILNGHESTGVLGLLATFATLAGSFLYTNETRRRERRRKEED